jgi:hypothetical protein
MCVCICGILLPCVLRPLPYVAGPHLPRETNASATDVSEVLHASSSILPCVLSSILDLPRYIAAIRSLEGGQMDSARERVQVRMWA